MSRNIPLIAVAGVSTFAWYAMPDVVRSRTARVLLKTGLVIGGGAAAVALCSRSASDTGPDTVDDALAAASEALNKSPGLMLGLGAASLAASAWGERAIFRFGERRRTRGAAWAHALPALVWGALAAAALAIDPPSDL